MALELDLPERGKEKKQMRKQYVLEERLFKTVDGEIVRAGDPRAAYVYRGPGRKIPLEEAVRLGLTDGKGKDAAGAQEPAEGAGETVSGVSIKDVTDGVLLDHFLEVGKELKRRSDNGDLDEAVVDAKAEELSQVFDDEGDEVPESDEVESEGDLTTLSRAELNEKAAELDIEKPDKIKGGKPAVIEAIKAKLAE